MSVILNIDTSVETASVCLAKDDQALQLAINNNQKGHATWLHPAIKQLMSNEGLNMNSLQAVAVTIGPGSYTGLRVGLSTAKGLCYALNIPLITINTLEMMAYAIKDKEADLFCPLIDARRMEVFMAIYNKNLSPLVEPKAIIIVPGIFDSFLSSNKILFSGTGSNKIKTVIQHPNAIFTDTVANAANMCHLSAEYFARKKFSNLAYTEPFYVKEFYSPAH